MKTIQAKEELFLGLGAIAYAVAMADGKVQPSEREEFREILEKFFYKLHPDFESSEFIFLIYRDEKRSAEESYQQGLRYLMKAHEDLTPELIQMFTDTLWQIAKVFPPTSPEEQTFIQRFIEDMKIICSSEEEK